MTSSNIYHSLNYLKSYNIFYEDISIQEDPKIDGILTFSEIEPVEKKMKSTLEEAILKKQSSPLKRII